MICLGSAGGRCKNYSCLLAANFKTPAIPPASCHCWLRGDISAVKNTAAQFTSIVNRSSWIARRPTYNGIHSLNYSGATNAMSATSGDGSASGDTRGGKASPVTRSVAVSGNRIESHQLFSSEREIMILHGEETYRLRLTSQNKLILTK
jgi:hemin uptake protein HemP